jgi:hypothetical protein
MDITGVFLNQNLLFFVYSLDMIHLAYLYIHTCANHPFQKQHTLLYLNGIKLFNNFKTIVLESINREYIQLSTTLNFVNDCNPNGSLYTNRSRYKLVFGVCADLRYINRLFKLKNKLFWGKKMAVNLNKL